MPRSRPLVLAAAALLLAACGGGDSAETIDTAAAMNAVPSGTPAGESTQAGGIPGTFMGDTTRDSVLGGDTTRRDSSRGTATARP